MSHRTHRWLVAAGIAGAVLPLAAHTAGAGGTISTGPSTVTSPYVLPSADGVSISSLLTVNDAGAAGNGYEMVGIPDGLGAIEDDGLATVFMNHELRPDRGTVRAHGEKGAFVSKIVVDKASGQVVEGSDLIQPGTRYWDYVTDTYAAAPVAPEDYVPNPANPFDHKSPFARFCSGFLSSPGQLYSPAAGVGFRGQLYFANEETGNEGRVFAVTEQGEATQLPRLGLFSWENTIVAPTSGATTTVIGNEDAAPGEVWVYVGQKQKRGSPVTKAGLTNGANHVVKIPGATTDAGFRTAYPKGTTAPFSLQEINWDQSGKAQNAEAVTEGGLGLTRVEDGAFDPDNPNDYYFVTTEGGDRTAAPTGSRDGGGLWRLSFTNVDQPALGGTLTLLLDGTEEWGTDESRLNKPDNVAIDADGNLLIQEDPGTNDHLARIVSYRIADGARGVVARFDGALFGYSTGSTSTRGDNRAVLTTDEESSGIIQLDDGSYLFDAQVHTQKGLPAGTGQGTVEEYVENGQLLHMRVADFAAVYEVFDD